MPSLPMAEIEAVVRRHVGEIERERRLPDAVVDEFRRSGLHRLAIPPVLGG